MTPPGAITTPQLPNPSSVIQASQLITLKVPAGQTIPAPMQGNSFYVLSTQGPVLIRPQGGTFVQYGQQQGQVFPNQFATLELENPLSGGSITVTLWIGWGYFVDNTRHQKQDFVVNAAGSATSLTIADISAPYGVNFGGVTSPSLDPIFIQRTGLYASLIATAGTTLSVVGPASGLLFEGVVPSNGKLTTPFLVSGQGPLTITSSASGSLQAVEIYQVF